MSLPLFDVSSQVYLCLLGGLVLSVLASDASQGLWSLPHSAYLNMVSSGVLMVEWLQLNSWHILRCILDWWPYFLPQSAAVSISEDSPQYMLRCFTREDRHTLWIFSKCSDDNHLTFNEKLRRCMLSFTFVNGMYTGEQRKQRLLKWGAGSSTCTEWCCDKRSVVDCLC